MAYSGPATYNDLEMDLPYSGEDDGAQQVEHWPALPTPQPQETSTRHTHLPHHTIHLHSTYHIPLTGLNSKHPMDSTSDSGSESQAPISKTPKHSMNPRNMTPYTHVPEHSPSPTTTHLVTTKPTHPVATTKTYPVITTTIPTPPAFAPRSEYCKLELEENPSVETKLRWLADVTNAFRLDRTLAEVKMAAVTLRFVYISRRREDIIERVTKGEL